MMRAAANLANATLAQTARSQGALLLHRKIAGGLTRASHRKIVAVAAVTIAVAVAVVSHRKIVAVASHPKIVATAVAAVTVAVASHRKIAAALRVR